MSQDRILGSATQLQIYGPNGPVNLAELDSFNADDQSELKKQRPLGRLEPHGQVVYGGWSLSFKGAKVNDDWDQIQYANDQALLAGRAAPRYRIVDSTTWYSGNVESWIYDDVLLYNFKVDKANSGEEIKLNFTGFASKRKQGGSFAWAGDLFGSISNLA